MTKRRRSPPSTPNVHRISLPSPLLLLILFISTILIKISLISSFVIPSRSSSSYSVRKKATTTTQHVKTTTTALYTTTTTTTITTANTHHHPNNAIDLLHHHPQQKTKSSSSSSKTSTPIITSYHLLSLPPLEPTLLSPTLRSLWRWKDYALGDGRDYFIPRPRAITALQNLILEEGGGKQQQQQQQQKPCTTPDKVDELSNVVTTTTTTIKECSVLSNCARLDILLVVQQEGREQQCRRDHEGYDDDDDDDESSSSSSSSNESSSSLTCRHVVSRVLASQLSSHSNNTSSVWNSLSSLLDLPNVISTTTTSTNNPSVIQDLKNELVAMEGLVDICHHLCLVAGGLADRPSRPGREVIFRPFSSRDAHIMLQLKRTAELAKGSRIRMILDSALRSGKACRDSHCVPEIESLRGYDGSGRYSREAPRELSLAAAEAAIKQAIIPSVDDCISKIKAMDASEAVSNLRQMAKNMVMARGIDWDDSSNSSNIKKGRMVKKIIHQPTIDLRQGRDIDYDEIVRRINDCLVSS